VCVCVCVCVCVQAHACAFECEYHGWQTMAAGKAQNHTVVLWRVLITWQCVHIRVLQMVQTV
jgi:hypothetical protein